MGLCWTSTGRCPSLCRSLRTPSYIPMLCHLFDGSRSRLALVGVMSGRSARDVERRVGIEGIVYVGNHGAEQIADGTLSVAKGTSKKPSYFCKAFSKVWRMLRDDPGLVLENKRYSASLHYRRAKDEAGVVERLRAAAVAML